MADPERLPSPRVSGVVLAAGRSTRFGGGAKQLHRIEGQSLVYRVARAALESELRQILVVAGYRAAEVGSVVAGLAVEVVVNPHFAQGQSTSVKAGLACLEPDAEAAVFIPCDLPHLEGAILNRLIRAHAESGKAIVVPRFGGARRAPVLVARSLFAEIEGITGDAGARQLFPDHEDEIEEVEFDSARPFEDLDRIE